MNTKNIEKIIKICECLDKGIDIKEISNELGVSNWVVSNIKIGKTWKSISKNYKFIKKETIAKELDEYSLLKELNKEIVKSVLIAKELKYPKDVIDKLYNVNSLIEIDNIMKNARIKYL